MIFVDGVGVGGGVVDRLRQLGYPVIEVNNGEVATRKDRYSNKAAETWSLMKEWLRTGSIPNDEELKAQLTGREYTHDGKMRIVLEKKDDMRERGLESPDRADALAMTFAQPVASKLVMSDRPAGLKHEFKDGSYYSVASGIIAGRNRCLTGD